MIETVCADCKAELHPDSHDTIYHLPIVSGDPLLVLCRACWRSREAHVRWEAHRGFPTALARQRRIEAALS